METVPASLGMPPLANLRDVGGHALAGGGRVRHGLLYRSTDLGGLEAAGVAAVGRLGIRTVYDLRTRDERLARPDRLPADARLVAADVMADAPPDAKPLHFQSIMGDTAAVTAALSEGRADRFFELRYREFVELESASRAYGLVFRDLAADGSRPALVHCTTGKDRTGWAVASLLLLLGVPEDAVTAEYLSSNAVMEGLFAKELDAFRERGGDPELLRPLIGVRSVYLEIAIGEMRRRFGDVEAYFESGLGVDEPTRRALREAFVEAAPGDPARD